MLFSSPFLSEGWSCGQRGHRARIFLSLFWAQAPTDRKQDRERVKGICLLFVCAGGNRRPQQVPLTKGSPLHAEHPWSWGCISSGRYPSMLGLAPKSSWSQTVLPYPAHLSVTQPLWLVRTGTVVAFSVLGSVSKCHASSVSLRFSPP